MGFYESNTTLKGAIPVETLKAIFDVLISSGIFGALLYLYFESQKTRQARLQEHRKLQAQFRMKLYGECLAKLNDLDSAFRTAALDTDGNEVEQLLHKEQALSAVRDAIARTSMLGNLQIVTLLQELYDAFVADDVKTEQLLPKLMFAIRSELLADDVTDPTPGDAESVNKVLAPLFKRIAQDVREVQEQVGEMRSSRPQLNGLEEFLKERDERDRQFFSHWTEELPKLFGGAVYPTYRNQGVIFTPKGVGPDRNASQIVRAIREGRHHYLGFMVGLDFKLPPHMEADTDRFDFGKSRETAGYKYVWVYLKEDERPDGKLLGNIQSLAQATAEFARLRFPEWK